MNYFSETSIFNLPRNSSGYDPGVHEIEVAASKALKNINLIYNEIMSPKDNQSDELGSMNSSLHDNPTNCSNRQNHYLRSCCSTLRELCGKCDNFISQCASCNKCNCNASYSSNFHKNKSSEHLKNFIHSSSRETVNNTKVKFTVPEPFSFCNKNIEWLKAKEHKMSKIKEELNNKIENELKVRVCTKPVPKSTHLPLYNQMVQDREKQKAERKEKCLEILNNAKPFNLHSKSLARAKSSSDLTTENANFKAKPVPKHILSHKVSEKLKNKEEIRKMLIAERAKDTMKQSSLPFSYKCIPHSRSMVNLNDIHKRSNKESKKNISEITKRLYVKKCNETMNSWNDKVLQVEICKKMARILKQDFLDEKSSFQKRPLSVPEEFPFLYFPVRMSNAAILREKQIRAEIFARNAREEKEQNEEFAKKKTNTDIAFKLRSLIPASDGEKEIDYKVKSFRESQVRRKQEYEKELEEIMKRVYEQNLLLERQSKVTKSSLIKTNVSDKTSEVEDKESQESIASDSTEESEEVESTAES